MTIYLPLIATPAPASGGGSMVACSFCSASSAACVSKVQGVARAAPSVSATDKKELLGGGEPLAPGAPSRAFRRGRGDRRRSVRDRGASP